MNTYMSLCLSGYVDIVTDYESALVVIIDK